MQSIVQQILNIVRFKLFQPQNPAAGEQGGDDFKRGVFSGGSNDGDQSLFYGRQEGVLLGLVETVDFINKQNRPDPLASLLFRFFKYLPDLFDPGHNGGEKDKTGAGLTGDDMGQGGLAAAGRPPEDHGRQLVCLNQLA